MNHLKIKLLALIALVTFAVVPAVAQNGPTLPAQCALIAPEAGHKVDFHVYAKGVQVYQWNAATQFWDFVEPRAALFAEDSFHGEIGTHFRGPNWQSKGGSRVKAAAVPGKLCTPDPTAIAWLLLQATENTANGMFKDVTFIQRVNTTGGLRPIAPGIIHGEIKEIEYTADYYFWKAENPNGN